jgi:hypothetical protein
MLDACRRRPRFHHTVLGLTPYGRDGIQSLSSASTVFRKHRESQAPCFEYCQGGPEKKIQVPANRGGQVSVGMDDGTMGPRQEHPETNPMQTNPHDQPGAPPGNATTATEVATPTSGAVHLAAAGAVGAVVALSLGFYGRTHTPTGLSIEPIDPANLLAVKSTLTSVGVALALFQLLSALWLYGRLPIPAPANLGALHRWSGTVAFLATLPVAYQCLWSLGFQTFTPRVLIHSTLGCAFYGAFATKLLVLRSDRVPGWALPLVGAGLVTLLVAIWITSALFYFTGSL